MDSSDRTDRADRTDKIDRTDSKNIINIKFDFPGHLCRAAFAILEFIIFGPSRLMKTTKTP